MDNITNIVPYLFIGDYQIDTNYYILENYLHEK